MTVDIKGALTVIYDEFRTAELNKEYYAERIRKTRRKLRAMDVYLAFFAAGSGVAGFALWDYSFSGIQIGQILFGLLFGIAIMLGIAKPYLKWEDELERISSIQGSYDSIAHILKDVVDDIKVRKIVSQSSNDVYKALRQIRGGLGTKEDKPADRALIGMIQDRVNERYPLEHFWWGDD